MKHGRVIERGSHDTLLALDGEYARLYRAQMDRSVDEVQEEKTDDEGDQSLGG